MKLEQALRMMMATALSTSSVHGHDDVSSKRKLSSIDDVVGTGCRNTVDFHARFKTDEGVECVSSTFCDGSAVNNLFIPKAKDVCLTFNEAEASCNIFEVVTEFNEEWMMKHITLKASGMGAETDPKSVTFLASNDSVKWEVLHTAEVKFLDRQQQAEFVVSNDSSYKYYSAQFHRDQNIMHLGKYGLVEDYTKACTSQMHAELTGDLIPYYTTLSPTSNPTTESPTNNPTESPTNKSTETPNDALKTAVDLWTSNRDQAIIQHGHISGWNTKRVTSMGSLFKLKGYFNDDISLWDTSSVTDMAKMFNSAYIFNSNISAWNVSRVEDMTQMFDSADDFNYNLSDWNVSSVKKTYAMFYYATTFDQVLCWDLTKASNTQYMFYGAKGGSLDSSC